MHSKTSILKFSIATFIIAVTLVLIWPPELLAVKQGLNYSVQVLLAILFVGLFFLVIGQRKLMYVSLGSCAALALYLKNASDYSIQPIVQQAVSVPFSIASVNLGTAPLPEDSTFAMLEQFDIVTFQEVTPLQMPYLEAFFKDYPFQHIAPRIDIFGVATFSRFPLKCIDTIMLLPAQPAFRFSVQLKDSSVLQLVSFNSYPPLNEASYRILTQQLDTLSSFVNKLDSPKLVVGVFNAVPWSVELQNFRSSTKLKNSNKGLISSYSPKSLSQIMYVPIDHIFHSDDIQCLDFKELNDPMGLRFSAAGWYQKISNETKVTN